MTDRSERPTLTLTNLVGAVGDGVAAIRAVTRLAPAGGPGDKVFPPTYQGGQYHTERRRVGDEVVDCVVLDSVQSQTNRMELALKAARECGAIELPLVVTDFTTAGLPHIGRVTALDAPHRIADAIFGASELDGTPFRDSEPGKRFASASQTNATPLFELCPTALVFGVWDSTGPKGGLGSKFARALVSEIVGVSAVLGTRTQSRLDPVPISAQVRLFATSEGPGADWTTDPSKAAPDSKGQPLAFEGRSREGRGKPAGVNLGNIPPDFSRVSRRSAQDVAELRGREGEPLPGGVTIDHALQTTVLSLPSLRRLRFPVDGEESIERNDAARTVLAAVALAAVVYQHREGFDLRSRCLLVPTNLARFEFVPADGGTPAEFTLDTESAGTLLRDAVDAGRKLGLPWKAEEIVLQPSSKLVGLVRRSEEVLARAAPEDLDSKE